MTLSESFYDRTFKIIAETSDIRNYKERSYCFLKLVEKDETGIIANADAVIWKQAYHEIKKFEKTTGIKFDRNLEIVFEVSVQYAPKWGLRLEIHSIDTAYTLGKIELKRREVLQNLVEGFPKWVWEENGIYHSRNQQLELPLLMQRIALITAPASDGQRDFKHELQNNAYGYSFMVDEYLTQIQGNGAEKFILNQFRAIVDSKIKYDVVILVRGGGAQTDFGPFDTLDLGKAIAAFPIPILTGIGHERNVSIADLMAHSTVKTPTKAANFLVEHHARVESFLIMKAQEILALANTKLDQGKYDLQRKALSLSRLTELHLERKLNQINQLEQAITYLNPYQVLERGFALLTTQEGTPIKDSKKIKTGETIRIFTQHSQIESVVSQIKNSD
ncbi:MAG: exodeoxyribonuclease VII large subunit [Bacteroidia bacterium]|nr:exodeoxyribonuclease VII large subunit [Bacteroidia bacterium]